MTVIFIIAAIVFIASICLGVWYYKNIVTPVKREQERKDQDNDTIDFFGEL